MLKRSLYAAVSPNAFGGATDATIRNRGAPLTDRSDVAKKTRPHARNSLRIMRKIAGGPVWYLMTPRKRAFQAHKSYLGNLSYCQSLGQSPKSLGILGTIHLDTQIIRLAKGYIFLKAV
jgi:hypothetical protein